MQHEGLEGPPCKRQRSSSDYPEESFGRPAPDSRGPILSVPSRVVLHLDLDCFYCQVEQLRLSIPEGTPCAVQQWEGLIAVNYEARAAGVTRHMRAAEARKVCPGIRLVHVQTIGEGGGDTAEAAAPQDDGEDHAGSSSRARLKEKACLERYRQASLQILGLIRKTVSKDVVVEKASIDEVYVDVTPMVDAELRSRGSEVGRAAEEEEDGSLFAWGSVVKGPTGLMASNWLDRRFAIGASVCSRLRGLVRSELGYTLSGGVASNKLLAKLGSAMHKPNQQTLILPRAVPELMADLPLSKINGFGGKLGAEVQELGCNTAGDTAAMALEILQKRLGPQRGHWVFNAVRGVCEEPVTAKGPPKSMLAAKSFNSTADMEAIRRWIGILADELAGRMTADEQAHHRRARNLVLHWRGGKGGRERSKSCQLPPETFGGAGGQTSATALARAGLNLLQRADDALPCSRLALSTTEFGEAPVGKADSIARFFRKPQQQQQQEGLRADDGLREGSGAPSAPQRGNSRGGIRAFLSGPVPAAAAVSSHPSAHSAASAAAEEEMRMMVMTTSPSAPREPPSPGCSPSPGSFPMWSAGFRIRTPPPAAAETAAAAATSVFPPSEQQQQQQLLLQGRAAPQESTDAPGSPGGTECGAAVESENKHHMETSYPSLAGAGGPQSRSSTWGAEDPEGPSSPDTMAMAGVDIEEQKKILRDIEMRRAAACPRSPVGRRPQPHMGAAASSHPHQQQQQQQQQQHWTRGGSKRQAAQQPGGSGSRAPGGRPSKKQRAAAQQQGQGQGGHQQSITSMFSRRRPSEHQ